MAGDEDDWHLREGRVALELLPDLEAAQLRHVNVQQHQVRHRLASKLERQAPRSCETKRSEVTKNIAQDANDGAIVVDQQNAEIFGSLHKVSDRHLRLMAQAAVWVPDWKRLPTSVIEERCSDTRTVLSDSPSDPHCSPSGTRMLDVVVLLPCSWEKHRNAANDRGWPTGSGCRPRNAGHAPTKGDDGDEDASHIPGAGDFGSYVRQCTERRARQVQNRCG